MATTRDVMLGTTTPLVELTLETATGVQDVTGGTLQVRYVSATGGGLLVATATAGTATLGIIVTAVPTATQIAAGKWEIQTKFTTSTGGVGFFPETDAFPVLMVRDPLATATS